MHLTFKVFLLFVWKCWYVSSLCILNLDSASWFSWQKNDYSGQCIHDFVGIKRWYSRVWGKKNLSNPLPCFSMVKISQKTLCEDMELRKDSAHKPGCQRPELIPLSRSSLGSLRPSPVNSGQQDRGQRTPYKSANVLNDAAANSFYFVRITFCHRCLEIEADT